MDRDRQLPLNFEPLQESTPAVVRASLVEYCVSERVQSKGADVYQLPVTDRKRQEVIDREAVLLERVLRRALHF